jgi:nucleoid-associated protein YgaU
LIFKPGAKTPVGGPLYVIAKKGDSLSGIIRRYYGDFNKKLLMEVIKENQTIQNENLIEVGQAIRLPQLSP